MSPQISGGLFMRLWTHLPISSLTTDEIQKYCVQDEEWQAFRVKLKGLSTEEKLDKLDLRMCSAIMGLSGEAFRRVEVQVDNYINALRRGGQLNDGYAVQK